MKDEIGRALNAYRNIKKMLDQIPEHLWHVFLPDSVDELAMLEADILAQKKRDVQRNKVMALQKQCGFMLRPNEPLDEVIARAKKHGLKDDSF
jgi:hypothetical protein